MAKTKISEFSSTPGNNTDIDSINIAEGCAPSGINDAIRELMAQLKDFQTGAAGDSFNGPVGTATAAAGAFTTLTASSTATLNTLESSGATLTGGTINGMAIGGTTAAAVSATTLTTSSTVTHNGGTANGVAYLNGSKVLTTGSALVFDGTNLGIGTSSPSAKLNTYFGTAGAPATSGSTDANLAVRFGVSSIGLDFGTYSAGGSWIQNRSISNYAVNYDLILQPNGGNLLVGATSFTPNDGRLRVAGTPGLLAAAQFFMSGTGTNYNVVLSNGNGQVGTISTAGSNTSFNTSSDYRLKHDIQPMTGALAKVQALKPVTYKWNSDDSNGEGFIAHELQAVVPECVTGEKDAVDADGNPQYQGIDTSFLVATLTAAIQEQQAIIQDMKARIEALEGAQP